jgi:hypothetical protein
LGRREKLVDPLTRGLTEVAEVEPWTSVFNKRRSSSASVTS